MKKNILSISTIILLLLSISSCGQNDKTQSGKSNNSLLDAPEFAVQLNSNPEKQIIDVRTPEEFGNGHISNAKNINIYDDNFGEQLNSLDKEKPVFVYCKAGSRSAQAAEIMKEKGFKTIYDLNGGIMAWTNNDMPVESANTPAKDKFTISDYEKIVSENKFLLIDYYAKWCAPCKKMEPVLEKLTKEYQGKVTIMRINVDEATALCKKLKIEAIPVFSVLNSGTEIKQVKGLKSEAEIRELLGLLK